MVDLTGRDSHFEFGKNWASYARGVSETQIEGALRGLRRLLGDFELVGRRFLDIGCGSGIHSLAALRLGAAEVIAVDLDENSVATTQDILSTHERHRTYHVRRVSIFDLDPSDLGSFDVVYSWGVFHHTGNLDLALRKAAAFVAPHGHFLFALYRRTLLCPFWRLEKRWYAHASPRSQRFARSMYAALYRARLLMRGQDYTRYLADYRHRRGMEFMHDVHDWLGGYPYESVSRHQVQERMSLLGFRSVRVFEDNGPFRNLGLTGSSCIEYVYCRNT